MRAKIEQNAIDMKQVSEQINLEVVEQKRINEILENIHNNLDEVLFSLDTVQNKMLYASIDLPG